MKLLQKITAVICLAALLVCLCSCVKANSVDIAFITDIGDVYDKSFNAEAWAGVSEYASRNSLKSKYYRPAQSDTKHFVKAVGKAVSAGAKTVVLHGEEFYDTAMKAGKRWRDVHFIVSGCRSDGLPDNVSVINYSTLEAGFLAGYSAVKNGLTNLGFQGNEANDENIDYCFGFIQGAERAASDLQLDIMTVEVKVNFASPDSTSDDIQVHAQQWYATGTQAIFACGEDVTVPVIFAAESMLDRWVICSETDKSYISETVLTSAEKSVSNSIYNALCGAFGDEKNIVLGVADGGVKLDMEKSLFYYFTPDDYEQLVSYMSAVPSFSSSLVSHEAAENISLSDEDEIYSLFSLSHILIFTS